MGKYDAQARYHAAHTTRVAIRFVHSTDKDILDHLAKKMRAHWAHGYCPFETNDTAAELQARGYIE